VIWRSVLLFIRNPAGIVPNEDTDQLQVTTESVQGHSFEPCRTRICRSPKLRGATPKSKPSCRASGRALAKVARIRAASSYACGRAQSAKDR